MKLIVCKNKKEASYLAKDMMLKVIKNKPTCTLGLATGSSPIDLYQLLVEDHLTHGTDYIDVKTFNLDEYCGLNASHPQSYYKFMNDHLFSKINIDPSNIHIPVGIGDVQASADHYNELLSHTTIDLQLLGVGSNGHIGFNEPGTSRDSVTHVVDLKESTINDNARLFFNGDKSAVPKQAISMGIKNIMDAKKIIVLAFGESKQNVIERLFNHEDSLDLPISCLLHHPDVTLIVDEKAVEKLNIKEKEIELTC